MVMGNKRIANHIEGNDNFVPINIIVTVFYIINSIILLLSNIGH